MNNEEKEYDKKEIIGKSVFYHGSHNDRVYISSLKAEDTTALLEKIDILTNKNLYSKVIAKVPQNIKEIFELHNYVEEAAIPSFINGVEDVFFMSKYVDPKRKTIFEEVNNEIKHILKICEESNDTAENNTKCEILRLDKEKLKDLAGLYKKVFISYPFPIFDIDYLEKTMDYVYYYGIYQNGNLVSAASSEIDFENKNAEMTDFATDPKFRGKGYASLLLTKMECDMESNGIKTLYTIARAISPGMNIVFSKRNYNYAGTLPNNTNISGNIECMNIWYKNI